MSKSGKGQQPRLLTTDNPLSSRLGADFFKAIPAQPGVYSFHDAEGTLLYIGQSRDLRARIGSYRHVSPEQHPRRTLRLVHRTTKVEWQECQTQEEAQELERALLLEKRPPFNRAGVWPGSPWWFGAEARDGKLNVLMSRRPLTQFICTGPLPSAFRHVHASLMRCTFRLLHPRLTFSQYPLGMLNHTIPLALCIETPEAEMVAEALRSFAEGHGVAYLSRLDSIVAGTTPLEQEFWAAELETLKKHAAKKRFMPVLQDVPPPPPLPLFARL